MNIRAKPLIIAAALALGASAPAFGQAGAGADSGGNTNAQMTPNSTYASPNPTNATPVTSGSGAPVVRGSAADAAYGQSSVVAPAPADDAARIDDDAHERAARRARATSEEEHGGVRNWMHDKKDRARSKLGMSPDDE